MIQIFGDIFTPINALWAFLIVVIIATTQQIMRESLYTTFKRFIKRMKREKAKILTKEIIEHRLRIRNEIEQELRKPENKNGIQLLLTDALRGGQTYEKNNKFLGLFRKWHYQKIIITDSYDKLMRASMDIGYAVEYSKERSNWVKSEPQGKKTLTAVAMGELHYDHVVAIDWQPSKTDAIPTLYYNYPFFKTFEREFFATHKKEREYDELTSSAGRGT
jgi:hypothetical protein